VNSTVVAEYVELCAQIAAEALFAEEVKQHRYDRLDQLWHAEMTEADRSEAQRRLGIAAVKERHDDRAERGL